MKYAMKYACVARDSSGGRCNKWAIEVDGAMIFCRDHLGAPEVEPAPAPDVILVQFYVGESTRKLLESSGIRRVERDAASLARDHAEAAQSVGRDPYRFSPRMKIASGAKIFEEDVPDVQGPAELFREFAEAGYLMTEVHWFRRQLRGVAPRVGACVIIGFSKSGTAAEQNPIINDLLKDCWQGVRVWANPPHKGTVVHCAEFYGRQTGRRRGRFALRFLSGLWAAEPIPEVMMKEIRQNCGAKEV